MDVITALHSRRSIRSYTDRPVSEEDIRALLEAAMAAPSAGNSQPWHFVVVRDKALLSRVPSLNPYAAMAAKAPLAIAVCGDLAAEKYPGYWVQDCAAATQNLLLAATGLGLGAVWTGIYPDPERVASFSDLFHLPEKVIPLALVVIGHSDSRSEPKSRYNEERVHHDVFKR